MTQFDQIRDGLTRAWETVAEGWQELRARTTDALTRFTPRGGGDMDTAEERVARRGSRWGLMTADVREEDRQVVVRLEAPGMEREDFDISVIQGRALVVRGEKRVEREGARGRYHVIESAFGFFERTVPLPAEVSDEGARARYRRGVLTITLPKSGGDSRRIEVKSQ